LVARAGAVGDQKDQQIDMHCHPTTSGSSHRLKGVKSCSDRTLQRRIIDDGATFRQLLLEVRQELAHE
jgi:hypothetical protein